MDSHIVHSLQFCEPELMTIFVTWQLRMTLRVTLDNIPILAISNTNFSVPVHLLQRICTNDCRSKNDERIQPGDWKWSNQLQPTSRPKSQQWVCHGISNLISFIYCHPGSLPFRSLTSTERVSSMGWWKTVQDPSSDKGRSPRTSSFLGRIQQLLLQPGTIQLKRGWEGLDKWGWGFDQPKVPRSRSPHWKRSHQWAVQRPRQRRWLPES